MTDISNDAYLAREAIVEAAAFLQAAHVRMRPRVFPDGAAWCCLYGDNLQEGVAGFGDTPAQACHAFDLAWDAARTPAAYLAAAPKQAEQQGVERLLAEFARLHEAARGCEFDLTPADGPIAQLTLFVHENGSAILAALNAPTGAVEKGEAK